MTNVYVSMSACSIITGTIQPVDQIAALVHKYSGYIFFDFATSAPYVPINMHANDSKGVYYDAIFVSTHKIPGGVSSPGILVFNKGLVCTNIPYTPNGGTVRFVSKGQCPVYSSNLETRETGGTPNILGIIRAGMAFAIKNSAADDIINHELRLTEVFQRGLLELCARHKGLRCLVPVKNTYRLPIFSIQLKGFHYNFIVVLLSDLFGITTRGGVNCSGILAEKLLKLNGNETQKIKDSILHGKGVPVEYGWVRITLTSIHTKRDILKVLAAIDYIAQNAHVYKRDYRYDADKNVFVYNGSK
jgi:selenocysteine lyase/cysteine desulfurase